MKKSILAGALAALVVLGWGASLAFVEPKGDEVAIKGEVIDLWCYLEGGDQGKDHKECAVKCAEVGNPIAILDEKGNITIALGIKDHQPGREVLIKRMADTVTVKGTLVKKGGVQAIYVKSVE